MQSVINSTKNNAAIMYPIIFTISMPVSTLYGVTLDSITDLIFDLKDHDFLLLIFRSLLFVTPVLYRQVIPDDRPTNFDTANVLDSNDSSPRRTATIRQTLHIATAR